MYRPVAGPFQGSIGAETALDLAFARQIEISFGVMAIVLAATVWSGAYAICDDPDLPFLLTVSSLQVLATCLLGWWVSGKVSDSQLTTAGQVYNAVARRLAQGDRQTSYVPAEGPVDCLAGLISDMAIRLRRHRVRQDSSAHATQETNLVLRTGRTQAQVLASEMRQDAGAMSEAATEIDLAGARIEIEVSAASQLIQLTSDAVSRAADRAVATTASVNDTTVNVEYMGSLAGELSRIVRDTQKSVTDLDEKSERLNAALQDVQRVLQSAASRAEASALQAAGLVACGPSTTSNTAELKEVGLRSQAALDCALSAMCDLISEAAHATRRVAEIAEIARTNQEVAYAIGCAVQQQGEGIGQVLQEIHEARSGFVTLRDGVEAVRCAGIARVEAAESLRATALRLPENAERFAGILRGIPDFAPPEAF